VDFSVTPACSRIWKTIPEQTLRKNNGPIFPETGPIFRNISQGNDLKSLGGHPLANWHGACFLESHLNHNFSQKNAGE
jgi:hypothetical protein